MKTATFTRLAALLFPASLIASACSYTSEYANQLVVASTGVAADGSRTSAIVEMPGMSRTLTPEQVAASAEFAVRARNGKILVKFIRVKGVADTIGRAQVSFDIVKGYQYYAGLRRLPAGSFSGCIGCSGSLKFPLTGSESASTDSLHIDFVYGVPLCKGCVAVRGDRGRMVAARE